MKVIKRIGVFETNSSSTHSIHIDNSAELLDTLPLTTEAFFSSFENRVIEPGSIIIQGDYYGWEIEDYYDAYTKADYMGVYAFANNHDITYDGKTLMEIFEEVLKEQTSCKEVYFNMSTVRWGDKDPKDDRNQDYGIDHQSVDSLNYHHLFEDPELLRAFIFNPKSYLHTDNDNH